MEHLNITVASLKISGKGWCSYISNIIPTILTASFSSYVKNIYVTAIDQRETFWGDIYSQKLSRWILIVFVCPHFSEIKSDGAQGKKRKLDEKEDTEEDYERCPRKQLPDNKKMMLPIKTKHGIVRRMVTKGMNNII